MFAVIHLSLSQATVRSLQVDLHGDLKWTETVWLQKSVPNLWEVVSNDLHCILRRSDWSFMFSCQKIPQNDQNQQYVNLSSYILTCLLCGWQHHAICFYWDIHLQKMVKIYHLIFFFFKTAGMWDSNWSKQHSFEELLWQIFIWLANEYFQYIWDWVKLTVVPMFTVTKVHKRLFFLISLVTGTYSISVCLCKSLGLFGWNQRTVTADGDCLPQVSCFSPGFAQREFPSLCSQRWPFTKTRPCCRARLCIVGIVLQLRETEFTWRAPAVSSDRLPRFNTSPSQQAGTHWEPGQLYKNEAYFLTLSIQESNALTPTPQCRLMFSSNKFHD